MKKTMKKILLIFILLALIMQFIPFKVFNNVFGTNYFLFSVGTGSYYTEIYTNTTVAEIINILGEPKIETPSAFGGKAYTFYTDSNYSNFLYIETMADGSICSFGSVDKTYKTEGIAYGDDYNFFASTMPLEGFIDDYKGKVVAGIYYNRFIDTNKLINTFKQNFESNPVYYSKAISEHGVTMYNAYIKTFGKESNIVFDDYYFYLNEQLKEFGSNIRTYLNNIDKTNYMKKIAIRERSTVVQSSKAYLLNPMYFAVAAKSTINPPEDGTIAIFDYDYKNSITYTTAINTEAFKEYKKVEMTADEKSKHELAKVEYNKAMENLNKESAFYKVEPEYENPESLKAGELIDSKKQGITDFFNAIRVAAGLPKVQLDKDCFTEAQYLSTLMTYRHLKLGLEITHNPTKPAGVSDEYFNIATGVGVPNKAECIARGPYRADVKPMLTMLKDLIDDRNETPMNLSHRSILLIPKFDKVGFGISQNIETVEIYGVQSSDVYYKAWPAKGVTLLESLEYRDFIWSMQFIDKYTIDAESTTVSVKCLNTDETWDFTELEKNSNRRFERNTTYPEEINNRVVFYDSTIYPEDGFVYEITLHNVKNNSTGKMVDYTYRTVFKYAEEIKNKVITSLDIEVPESITKEDNGVYIVEQGQKEKLNAVIDPMDANNNLIEWKSSNPNVVFVTQNGLIEVKGEPGTQATISINNKASGLSKSIILKVNELFDPNAYLLINKYSYQFNNLGEKLELNAYLSNGKNTAITWSTDNSNVADVSSNGLVTAKRGGFANIYATSKLYGEINCLVYVSYPVTLSDGEKAYVGDLDGNGVIDMNDASLILEWYRIERKAPDDILIADIDGNEVIDSNDASLISQIYCMEVFRPGNLATIREVTVSKQELNLEPGGTYKLTANIIGSNTQYDKTITWLTNNDSVAEIDQTGKITAINEGTATITAKSSNGKTANCIVTVKENKIEFKLGDINNDGTVNATDYTIIVRYLKGYENLNEIQLKAADVDKNGTVNATDYSKLVRYLKGYEEIEESAIYVSETGNDETGDGTEAKPYNTIEKAIEDINTKLNTGIKDFTVNVASGNYTNQSINIQKITNECNINIIGDSNKYPIFNGQIDEQTNLEYFMELNNSGKCNFCIKNIKIENYDNGIYLIGEKENISAGCSKLENVEFYNIGDKSGTKSGYAAIDIQYSNNNIINNCKFENVINKNESGLIHGIYIAWKSNNNVICNNEFINVESDPIRIRDASNNNKIYNNIFTKTGKYAYCSDWYNIDKLEEKSYGNEFYNNELISSYNNSQIDEVAILSSEHAAKLSLDSTRIKANENAIHIENDRRKFVRKIAIVTNPQKNTYLQGEESLNLEGGIIDIVYATDDKNIIERISLDNSILNVTGFDSSIVGTNTITVEYKGASTTFNIEIQ